MHQALYRKYRPASFDDVYGQEHITDVLAQQVKAGSISHAYLFCGSRGTGKTTCAKILAKAANCHNTENGNPCGVCETCRSIDAGLCLDVIEMDAASNTGVDYIRDIKEEVSYSAASVDYRVYILDEVHMLTESAFNALLKTLEEPPSNVIFILATTELAKIPATVLSRCLRFDFRRIPVETIAKRLKYIADNEGISIDDDAATLIGVLCAGGMRDAIGMLELAAGKSDCIDVATVREVVGIAGRQDVERSIVALEGKDFPTIFSIIDSLYKSSKDLSVFTSDLLSFCRDLLLIKACGKKADRSLFDMTGEEFERTCALSEKIATEKLLYYINVLEDTFVSMNKSKTDKRLLCEVAFVQMGTPSLNTTPKALLARIADLESGVSIGYSSSCSLTPAAKKDNQVKSPDASTVNQTSTEKTSENRSDVKACSYWSEIVSKYNSIDMGTATFLQRARAYNDDSGTLYVYVGDSFTEMMISKDEVRSNIERIARSFDSSISAVSVSVRKSVSQQDESKDPFNSFIKENSEE